MASNRIYITGTAMWAKLFERNRDTGDYHTETDGITSVCLLLEKEELGKLKASGSRLRPAVTDDGLSVKFRRPWKHRSIAEFGGAPQVVDKDDKPWDDSVSIGNGSKVTVAITVYDTAMGKGTRLEGVKVLELVPYDNPNAGEPNQPKLPF
jgi:hypothetical protein